MEKVLLKHHHLELGKPIPYDLLDPNGIILLKNGYVLQSLDQLNRLIERGVTFCEILDEEQLRQQQKATISVFEQISQLANAYEALFEITSIDYRAILPIAESLQHLCELDSDAALAIIQLHRSRRYSLLHAFHSAVLTEILLKRLERPVEDRRDAVAAVLTMNISMLSLQDELYTQNTPLSLEQKRDVVSHPLRALQTLQAQGIERPVWLDVVEHHHEMIDGSGYPKRLAQPALSIESQAASLADRYCAMVAERSYRAGMPPTTAKNDLLLRQAATIDPALAQAFTKEVGNYPPGALVELVNGEIAVVVKRLLNPDQPLVRSLRSPSGIAYAKPPKHTTNSAVHTIRHALSSGKICGVDWASLWSPIELDESAESRE